MWWLASVGDVVTDVCSPDGAGGAVLRADWIRLRHGPPAPADEVIEIRVPGCTLIVIGTCSISRGELVSVARRVAAGEERAVEQIDGSRVVIAVRPDAAVVLGDLAGQQDVFHGSAFGEVVIGSTARQLATQMADQLNRQWLAARLLAPGAVDVWTGQSPWQQVHALRPGFAIRLRRGGGVRVEPFVRLPAPGADLDSAASALRAALERAVRARVTCAETVTSDLSGGLDSSTITAVAAQERPVHAMTMAMPGIEDAEIAKAAAAALRGVDLELVHDPRDLLPYAELDQLPSMDGPSAFPAVAARELRWLRGLAERNSGLHLTGDGGDAVLGAPPGYLADLASVRRAGRLWRHAGGWAHLRHVAAAELARAATRLRRQPYRTALLDLAASLRDDAMTTKAGWIGLVSWISSGDGAATWATAEARNLASEAIAVHAATHPVPLVPGPFGVGDSIAWQALTAFSSTQRVYRHVADGLGVNVHAPFLDDGVIRACWSVASWVRTTPERPKPLLHAMRGVVPDIVLQRRTKGNYTDLAYQGIRQHHDTLRDLFSGSRLAKLGLVDEAAVAEELGRGVSGLPLRLGAFDLLVGAEVWLRSMDHPADIIVRGPREDHCAS